MGISLGPGKSPTTQLGGCPSNESCLTRLISFPHAQVYIDEKGNVFPGQGPTGR